MEVKLDTPTTVGEVTVCARRADEGEVRLVARALLRELRAACHEASTELVSSISHSGDMALVALVEAAHVGVDLERPRRFLHPKRLAARILTPVELAAWEESAVSERDLELRRWWTRKEACAKLDGHGLRAPLSRFEFARSDGAEDWLAAASELGDRAVRVVDLALERGFVGAVAWCGLPLVHAGTRGTTTP